MYGRGERTDRPKIRPTSVEASGYMHARPATSEARISSTRTIITLYNIINMSDHENFAKRRKVRKGTQSCWECRRRKVRCIFSISTNTVCDHCARRGTPCVSQEMCEEPSSNVKTPLESRIGRIEELLAQHEVARDVREPVLNRPRSVSFDDGLDATVSTTSHEAGVQVNFSWRC